MGRERPRVDGPFLDQVVGVLRGQEAGASNEVLLADFGRPDSQAHGSLRKEQGFDVSCVIHDYGTVCDTVHELAGEAHQHFGVEGTSC